MNKGLLGYPLGLDPASGLLGFPLGVAPARETKVQAVGVSAATSTDTTISAHAGSANVKGSYTQLSAALPFDADGFYLVITDGNTTRDYLIDIAIGPAGSEVDILPNVQLSSGSLVFGKETVFVPLQLRAGERLAARLQSSTANQVVSLSVVLIKSARVLPLRLTTATTYGANLADSGGTSIDPGAVAHTKGAWVELSPAVEECSAVIVCIGTQLNTAIAGAFRQLVDIGVGTAGSEVVVIGDISIVANAANDCYEPLWRYFPVAIPAGSRLVARSQCTGTDATDRLFDVSVIGFT